MEVKSAIEHYCRYQERSHKEVRNKLYELGCSRDEVEENIVELIQEDLLNEERYARALARGKFRMKQWGKNKIIQQLKFQQVSDYCIQKALTEIDEEDYWNTARSLVEKKKAELRTEKNHYIKKQKVYRYLYQKGFESNLIYEIIKEIFI